MLKNHNGFVEEDDASDESEEDSIHVEDLYEEDLTWIEWFCSLKGNEYFVEVDEEYILDDFNLTGLSTQVPFYNSAMEIILDGQSNEEDSEHDQEELAASAEMLFGLIHARYIVTTSGLVAMKKKYSSADFGRCPRAFCEGFPLLPVGQSDLPCQSTVKLYCGRCEDIYSPNTTKHAKLDGSHFGTSFPHIFLLTYPECRGTEPARYVPKIFGFKLHRTCQFYNNNNNNNNNTSNNNSKSNNNNNKSNNNQSSSNVKTTSGEKGSNTNNKK